VSEMYVAPELWCLPVFLESTLTENCNRTKNGPDSFHLHFNEQSYSDHHPEFSWNTACLMLSSNQSINLLWLSVQHNRWKSINALRRWDFTSEKQQTVFLTKCSFRFNFSCLHIMCVHFNVSSRLDYHEFL
jgi:hypothetical protein